MGSPLAMVEDKESEAQATCGFKEMFEGSSQAQSPDESKLRSIVTENTGDEIPELGLSEVDSFFYGQNGVMKPESADENVSVDSLASLIKVNSPGFDVDIQVDGFQAVGEKLDLVDSNSHHVPSNDSHLSAHEERQPAVVDLTQSLSDKSMLKPRELSDSISNNKNISKVYDPEEKMSDFTSDSPDSLEYKSTDGGMNMEDHHLHKIVYEDYHQVLEHSNSPGETYGPPMAEDNVNEEEDEMKEIDEELLSELDTVRGLKCKEKLQVSHSMMNKYLKTLVFEVGSVEDIDLGLKQPHEGVNVEEVVEEQLAEDESKLQN
ncbi:hypothetical protein OIU74_024448 [Salix koriyanagi]|uniref:Uncharacterized protein n=1 Tax=Salix koriyanagi TaxID=2511006 RepID=A0A9Q1A8I7_9ROSI|nr:hypothetical protein OIU74_024448 [Salix koriyanagi]